MIGCYLLMNGGGHWMNINLVDRGDPRGVIDLIPPHLMGHQLLALRGDFSLYNVRDDVELLRAAGVIVEGPSAGASNWVAISNEAGPTNIVLKFASGGRNGVVVGPRSRSNVRLTFLGSGNFYADAGERSWGWAGDAIFRGDGAHFLVGVGSTSFKFTAALEGPLGSIEIGRDCMLARDGTDLLPSDSHAIVDLHTMRPVNVAKPVVLGDHVWLGTGSKVLKGVTIGDGAIISSGAIVTKDIPAFTAAAGAPATTKRIDVSWTRSLPPTQKHLDELTALRSKAN